MSTGNSTPLYACGKIVGFVESGVFVKRVLGSKHQLFRPPGWALDVISLAEAQAAGAKTVRIEDIESGRVYQADIDRIQARGFQIDRHWGRQIVLPLAFWCVDQPGVRQLQMAL